MVLGRGSTSRLPGMTMMLILWQTLKKMGNVLLILGNPEALVEYNEETCRSKAS